MFTSDCLSIGQNGNLFIEGVDAVELAARYGTPLCVLSETEIRNNCRAFRASIDRFYGGHGAVAYASKALSFGALYTLCHEEGLRADVVSGGELYTALRAGFPPADIYFHGNNKTMEELIYAVEAGVGTVVVDNLEELHALSSVALSARRRVDILFRIKPGIDAHTHDFVRTGQIDSKFGFALETGEAMAAIQQGLRLPGVAVRGIHCHIGSQIFDIDPFTLAAEVMVDFLASIRAETGEALPVLNLGGGFGIKYLPEHSPTAYERYMEAVSVAVRERCAAHGLPLPFVVIEPGRSIVGAAGITLYTVGAVKEIPGVRTYLSVDGGITDNPRYALYRSSYDGVIANRAGEPKDTVVTVAGRCCESGDLLQENMALQRAGAGDYLALFSTGAYTYSMASNYNRVPRPAIVMVKGDTDRLVVRRESYEDIVRNDVFA